MAATQPVTLLFNMHMDVYVLISGAVIIAVISFITLRKARIGGPIEQYDVVLQGLRAHALRRV